MNANEINEAIAEAIGDYEDLKTGHSYKYSRDYYGSLDACAMFEKTLSKYETWQYEVILREVVCGKTGFWYVPASGEVFQLVSSTASQRSEAFLRLKSLWKE